jgi:hypothetical protein
MPGCLCTATIIEDTDLPRFSQSNLDSSAKADFTSDGPALSGSGALDRLAQLANSGSSPTDIVNAPFAPAVTPYDWLSRDPTVADAFMRDHLMFRLAATGCKRIVLCGRATVIGPCPPSPDTLRSTNLSVLRKRRSCRPAPTAIASPHRTLPQTRGFSM